MSPLKLANESIDTATTLLAARAHALRQGENGVATDLLVQIMQLRDVAVATVILAGAMSAGVRTCRVCGCTDADCSGCIEKTGKPCHWVGPHLCSACAPKRRAPR